MNVAIINIGDELLIGQVVNTNAAHMSQLLTAAGMDVTNVETIGDDGNAIRSGICHALTTADAVICTGGLGPTKDDITKNVLMHLFGGELVENKEQLSIIESIFAKRGYTVTEVNRQQSWTPSSCTTIPNPIGTAPAMWFEVSKGKYRATDENVTQVVISAPGVPFEVLNLMKTEIIPRLQQHFCTQFILTKNILTQGIGESFLSDLIEKWELALPSNVKLAYLPQAGMTKLRLTARGNDRNKLSWQLHVATQYLYPIAGKYIVAEDCETLAEAVSQVFRKRKLTLATAESCTGGYIASQLTQLAGASEYFKGGMVSYCNETKQLTLGVKDETLNLYTAVSSEAACEMAEGVRTRLHSDYSIATTGVAGPTGDTQNTPVGTVWIAIATPHGTQTHLGHFGGNDRLRVIERATNEAFHLLISQVAGNKEKIPILSDKAPSFKY